MAETTIEEIMSPVHHVNSDIRIDEAIAYMLSKDTGAILIKNEQGEYVGIFTKADLIKLLNLLDAMGRISEKSKPFKNLHSQEHNYNRRPTKNA